MEALLTLQFEKVLLEYRALSEATSCIDAMITHIELREKDKIM